MSLPPRISWRYTTVGIIDDSIEMRRTLRGMMNAFGVTQVVEASDGAEFLSITQSDSSALDLLLVDDEMKPLDGLGMMRSLRSMPTHPCRRATAILMAGHGNVEIMKNAIEAGYHSLLPKPFSADVLNQHIQRVLTRPMTWREEGEFLRPILAGPTKS